MKFLDDFVNLFPVGCFILAGINEHDLLLAVDVAVEMVKNEDNGIPVPCLIIQTRTSAQRS